MILSHPHSSSKFPLSFLPSFLISQLQYMLLHLYTKTTFFIHITSVSLRDGFEGFSLRRLTCSELSFLRKAEDSCDIFTMDDILLSCQPIYKPASYFFPVLLITSGIRARFWPMDVMLVFMYTVFFYSWNRYFQKDLVSLLKWLWHFLRNIFFWNCEDI